MTPPAAMTSGMAFHADFLGEVAEWPNATALRYGTQVTLCRKFESFPLSVNAWHYGQYRQAAGAVGR